MEAIFYVRGSALAVVDNGDFLQLRNGAGRTCEILEIRVWQTSDTILAMNAIRFQRGAGGAAGAALTERKNDIVVQNPVVTAFSLPTTDVGTLDLDVECGWNILQEFVWLPTPHLQMHLSASDHLGISLLNADTLTIGCGVWWTESGA